MNTVRQIKTDPHFESLGQAASSVVAKADPYAFWNKALAIGGGRQLTRDQSKSLGVTMEPKPGFYRKRNKGGSDIPVAIWNTEGGMVALAGDRTVEPDEIWTWCCSWPIAHAVYEAVTEHGKPWPDDAPVAESVIGHNHPDDPHEAVKMEFAGERELAEKFLEQPVTTQEQADMAAVWAKKLSEMYNTADKLFRAKKDPIVAAGRAVDDEFRWREEPKALSVKMKRAQDDFLNEQDRLEQERQRKAREEADRIRREAEEAAHRAAEAEREANALAEAGNTAEVDEEALQAAQHEAARKAEEAKQAEREAEARRVQAGRTGARTSLRTFVSGRVVDYDKALIALKDHPEMKALVEQLANRAVKAGVSVAGVERVEEKRAA